MAVEEVISNSGEVLTDVVFEVGKLGLWLQAIGGIVVLWVLFQFVNFILNRKKRKALYRMSEKVDRIEKKIDKLIREDRRQKPLKGSPKIKNSGRK